MKILLLSLLTFCLSVSLYAQQKEPVRLVNTKWSGVAHVPQEIGVFFCFTKDTVSLIDEDNSVLEQMIYTLNEDTLILKKISGNSPCGEETGIYKIDIKDNKLSFIAVQDECSARKYAFENPYSLVEKKKN